MTKRAKIDSKEMGLAAGLVFARYFLKSEHLHYGYWDEGLSVDVSNLRRAQERYSEVLLARIPAGTRTILDVGCGTGILSRRMLDAGYQVQSVSPSPILTSYAREVLGGEGMIHESTFEELDIPSSFDLILFAESFQYIDLSRVFGKCRTLLEPGGAVLLSDFFVRDDSKGVSGLGGGHRLGRFHEKAAADGFSVVSDEDITTFTAQNMDLVGDLLSRFGRPMWDLMLYALDTNHPRLSRLLRWRYGKRIAKMEGKYFSGRRSAATFAEDKSYRMILLKPGA